MSTPTERERYEAYVGRIARGAGMSSLGGGLGRLLLYATQVALARMYGPAQLGYYVLGITVVGAANILAQFGMENFLVRYVAHYQNERDTSRVKGTIIQVLCITFLLSLVLSGLCFFGAGFLADKVFGKPFLETIFRAFSVSIPFFTVMSMALWATQGFQTVKYQTAVQEVLRPFVNLLLVIVFYLLGTQIFGAIAAYGLSMAAGSAFALYYLYQLFPKLLDRDIPSKFKTKALFTVSMPMFVGNLTQYADTYAAVTVLGIFATAEAVGIYSAAARTAFLSALVLFAFSGIFAPIVSNLYGRGLLDELGYLYKDVSRWVFTGGLAAFLLTTLLSKDIMAIYGGEFVSGWSVMVLIAGAQLFNSSVGPTTRVLAMTGYQKIFMLAMSASVVTSLGGSLALVPLYGIFGAAIATTAALALSNTITLLAVRRLLGFWPYNYYYLKPLAAGLLVAIVAFLISSAFPLPQGLPAVLVLSPLFLAGFVIVLLALGLSPSDRQFFQAFWLAVQRMTKGASSS